MTKVVQIGMVAALLVSTAWLTGCGGNAPSPAQTASTAPTKPSSGSTGSGSGTGQATAGQLVVSPASLSFGNVPVGQSASLAGTLTAGNADVTVSSADWNGQGFSVSGISFPTVLSAGQSASFTVTFTPQASGSASGIISFLSNATNSPGNETLSGSGESSSQVYTVNLSWDPSTSPVTGYNVYRGTNSGGPYGKLTTAPQPQTSYSDPTAQGGTTYYYVATSIGTDGKESGYSNQTVAVIP